MRHLSLRQRPMAVTGLQCLKSCQELSSRPCSVNAHAPHPAQMRGDRVMSPTIAECLEHADNVNGTLLERTMKGTANSFFGGHSSGLSWPARKS